MGSQTADTLTRPDRGGLTCPCVAVPSIGASIDGAARTYTNGLCTTRYATGDPNVSVADPSAAPATAALVPRLAESNVFATELAK